MSERQNILIRIFKWLGLIVERGVSKSDMCKQAQGICNHECEDCAWNEQRGAEYKKWETKPKATIPTENNNCVSVAVAFTKYADERTEV